MTSSRATVNAKLLQKYQRQKSSAEARSSANKFTQKQSRFELRSEEEHVRRMQQQSSSASHLPSVGDQLLSKRQWGSADGVSSNATESPSPFAIHQGHQRTPTPEMTTASPTLGLGMLRKKHMTRSTRRAERFNLSAADRHETMASQVKLGGGLLGTLQTHHAAGAVADTDGEDGAPRKKTREERFKEVMLNSKSHRAQLQREKAERDEHTKALDTEINSLLHLLPKRDKVEEEREAFKNSGTPEVRALLQTFRHQHVAKHVSIKSNGQVEIQPLSAAPKNDTDAAISRTDASAPQPVGGHLDVACRALLQKVRAGATLSTDEPEVGPLSVPAGAGAVHMAEDDFDVLMNQMRQETKRAHAVDHTLTEEEEAELAARQELLEADRQALPSLRLQEREQVQLTRGEWVQQGGDKAYHMSDDDFNEGYDDNVDIPSSYEGDSDAGALDAEQDEAEGEDGAARVDAGSLSAPPLAGSRTLDSLLSEIEAMGSGIDTSSQAPVDDRSKRFHALLVRLHRYATSHVLEVTKAFRMILIEAEKAFLRQRRSLCKPLLLYLYAITKVFPMSDYRHEVTTPFLLFLCSTLLQMKLDSLDTVHSYLVLGTLLTNALLSGSGKFAAEVAVAPWNVLSLQLPLNVLEPVRYQGLQVPFPLVERCAGTLLSYDASDTTGEDETTGQIGILDSVHSPTQLLLCAYRLLSELADAYRLLPAFPVIFQHPFASLDSLLTEAQWKPHPSVAAAHDALGQKIESIVQTVKAHRTPLAMRTFRPRPLRQFEPLLAEREEQAASVEVRAIKREIREDKKRVMRHLTAEATVARRAREKEHTVAEAQREKRYHQLMGQLQSQQHIMNTVDTVMAKGRSKKKKSISGAPKESSGEMDV